MFLKITLFVLLNIWLIWKFAISMLPRLLNFHPEYKKILDIFCLLNRSALSIMPSSRRRQAPCPFYGACLNLETAVILFLPPFSSVIYRRMCPSRRAFVENYSDCSPLLFFLKNEPPWRIGHFVYRKAKKGASCVFLSDLKGVDNYINQIDF